MDLRKGPRSLWRFALLAVALLPFILAPELHAARDARRFAVTTEHPLATEAALAQLRAGGNAVDAAVTAALMAGVVNGTSSGIGGGGFSLYWDAKAAKASILDFRETAPQRLDTAAFVKRPLAHEARGKAVGVPGEVAGLFQLHQRSGKLPWADVVRPAIQAAAQGFAPSPHMARALSSGAEALRRDSRIAELFFPGSTDQAPRLFNPGLAHVLGWLSEAGPAAVYDSPVAGDIVATVAQAKGTINYSDLQAYRVIEREPLRITWEGYEIHTMPLPSAGGVMLAQVLGMFSKKELASWGIDSGAYVHHVAEAMRAAFADRFRYLSDPSFEKIDVAALLAPERLRARRGAIEPFKTRTLPQLVAAEHGTHHLTVADAEGNIVSLTTTVNNAFGAKLMTKSGILLNDQLSDFSWQSDAAAFGLGQSPNRPRPLARPVSSMTPTLVLKDGKPVLALGGSGGFRIAPNVTQALLARLVFGISPRKVVERPRFAVPVMGSTVLTDSVWLQKDLQARGEQVGPLERDTSAVQLIAFEHGRPIAAADPRKAGLAITQ